MLQIDWTNPTDPANYEDWKVWAADYHRWHVERTSSPAVSTYKAVQFGSDIAWAGGLTIVPFTQLYLHKDPTDEIVHITGNFIFMNAPAGNTVLSARIPDEYAPSYATSQIVGSYQIAVISIFGPGAGVLYGANCYLQYVVDGWYLGFANNTGAAIAGWVSVGCDMTWPHKEVL